MLMRDPLIHRRLIFAVLALLATALAGASAAGQAEQERSSLNEKLVIIAPQALRHAIGDGAARHAEPVCQFGHAGPGIRPQQREQFMVHAGHFVIHKPHNDNPGPEMASSG